MLTGARFLGHSAALGAEPLLTQLPIYASAAGGDTPAAGGDGQLSGVVDLLEMVALRWDPADGSQGKEYTVRPLGGSGPLAEAAAAARAELVERLSEVCRDRRRRVPAQLPTHSRCSAHVSPRPADTRCGS